MRGLRAGFVVLRVGRDRLRARVARCRTFRHSAQMTPWQAYLLLFSRFGLAPKPDAGTELPLPSLRSLVDISAGQWVRQGGRRLVGLPLGLAFALAGQG